VRRKLDSVDALARALRGDGGGAILFAGANWTGKRMAAEMLSGQLGLELYRTRRQAPSTWHGPSNVL
jgi:hypothetical protein